MDKYYHLVARANPGLYPLKDREGCVDLWQRLKTNFPESVACVLMHNHLHLLAKGSDPNLLKRSLGIELRSWTQRFHLHSQIWMSVPLPTLIPSEQHLKIQIRYVHLNPCRARLVKDPLEWEWSTHQDVTGCVSDPWPDLKFLAQLFKTHPKQLGSVMHKYISSDPTVSVSGTDSVRTHLMGHPMSANLEYVFFAVAHALRVSRKHERGKLRNLTIHTAYALKIPIDPAYFGISQSGLVKILKKKPLEAEILPVLRVLGDSRISARL